MDDRRSVPIALAVIFMVVMCTAAALGLFRTSSASAAGADASSVATTILTQTNAARAKHGLAPLTYDTTLAGHGVEASAVAMATSGVLVHDSDILASLDPQPTAWGENLAHGMADDEVVAAWLASAPQRANLLGDYDAMAVGYAVDAHGHAWYVLELIGD
jgi:uncharacterized protein YkwD